MIYLYKILFFVGLLKSSIQINLPENGVKLYNYKSGELKSVSNIDQDQNPKKLLENESSRRNVLSMLNPAKIADNLANNDIHKVDQQTLKKNIWRIVENRQISDKDGIMRRNSHGEPLQSHYARIEQNNVNSEAVMEDKLAEREEENGIPATQELNSQLTTALPVNQPQIEIVGYRRNRQYYLLERNARDNIQKTSSVQQISFLNAFRPGQDNIQLTKAQIEMYRKYLVDTGLIALKPYRLIFSQNYWLPLSSLRWMVVNLELNSKSDLKPSKKLYKRDTFWSAFAPKPMRLLVPVLKIRKGLQDTVTGTQTIMGGLQEISGGMLHMAREGLNTAKDVSISVAEHINLMNNENTKSDRSNENNDIDNEKEKPNT